MKCESIQSNLLDYGKGLLSRSESEDIKAHISGCCECAAFLEEEMAFACKLATLPEEKLANDVWAVVRMQTKPRRLLWDVIMGAAHVQTRKLVATGAVLAVVLGVVSYNSQPVEVSSNKNIPIVRTVMVESDEPMAKQTDAMIDVMERM